MTTPISNSEYSAVRGGGAGLIDLSARGRILVRGSEAVMFLNGLITNDMKTLAVNSWMPAAFANVQGRLLAAVRIIHRADGFLIDTESVTREAVIKLLDRFTLAGDFHVTDFSDKTTMLSVQGSGAAGVVRKVLGEPASVIERHQVTESSLNGASVTAIRATHTAEDGFDLVTGNGADLRKLLTAAGASQLSNEAFETLRIEAGIPLYGIDMDETNVVTETNLDDAVSFTKGCYVGQEIIVRIRHRGHVAKKFAGVTLDGPEPGPRNSKILLPDDKEVGRITSSTFSPKLGRAIALAYLKYDYLAAGTAVRVIAADREVSATVAELPFIRGSWYHDR
jgi:folate-binding protein YgfZ